MTSAASAPWGILKPDHVAVLGAADDTAKSGAHLVRLLMPHRHAGASLVDQEDIARFRNR
jgi:hypothetical protein